MSATATQIETEIDRLIEGVVGQVEAADIDLDTVTVAGTDHTGERKLLEVGDQSRDGAMTVHPGDTVTVWAQGDVADSVIVRGAYDHFAAKL